MITLLLYQVNRLLKISKNGKKITTSINISVLNTHLNIRTIYLHTISGSGSI